MVWCSSTRPPHSASTANTVPPIPWDLTPQRRETLWISASKHFQGGISTKSGLFRPKAGHAVSKSSWQPVCLAPKILGVLFLWMNCTHVLSFSLLRCSKGLAKVVSVQVGHNSWEQNYRRDKWCTGVLSGLGDSSWNNPASAKKSWVKNDISLSQCPAACVKIAGWGLW